MKTILTPRKSHSLLLALLIPSLVLVACDNQVNVSPTLPDFTEMTSNVGAVRTVRISGHLAAEQGSSVRATILFNGEEIEGARSRCQEVDGCTELELAGVVGAFAGHHTITFQVLRQLAETEAYLATGTIEISRAELQFPEPVVIDLQPIQATLQTGEGVTFEIDLRDSE